MTFQSVLPPGNATDFQRALEASTDLLTKQSEAVTRIRGIKLGTPPSAFLPFLIYEYGLGELSPYVPNLYDLIREGIAWQRIRGTHQAVKSGLGWLDFTGDIEEPSTRRLRWNLFQLALGKLALDEEDLGRIEGIAQLSAPVRSYFWRGFHGYDIRALEYSRSKWGNSLYSAFSGVRIGGQAKWSFGRSFEFDHSMTEGELTALNVWVDPTDESSALNWGAFNWGAFPWVSSAAAARSATMLNDLLTASIRSSTSQGAAEWDDGDWADIAWDAPARRPHIWVVYKDADGGVIGYRRAKAVHPVRPVPSGGQYRINGTSYGVADRTAVLLYVEALTDFGNGFPSAARSIGLVFNAAPVAPLGRGSLWVGPDGLDNIGPVIAEQPVSFEFGRTVRTRTKFLLRF